MKMRLRASAAAGVLTVAGLAGSASAGLVVIDDFDSIGAPNPWPVSLNAAGNVTVTENGVSALGGTRQTYLEAVSVGVPGLDFVQVSIAAAAGLLDFNSTVDTDAFMSLTYDGGGSLNADFSAMTGIEFSFSLFDHADGASLPVTAYLSDGVNVASHTLSLNAPGPQLLAFNFNDFAGLGGVDLSSITSIRFDIDPGVGADFRITQIVAIPAPAAIALLGLGLAAPRRRRH